MELFDVGIIEGDKLHPMHRETKRTSGDWWTHCITFKNEQGDTWDPRPGGILSRNISDYGGRRIEIFRYKKSRDNDRLLTWAEKTVAECEGYDFEALLGFITGEESFQNSRRWYCSEFPYELHQENGYLLTRVHMNFPFPNFFHYSNEFELVEEFVIPGEPKVYPEYEMPFVAGPVG